MVQNAITSNFCVELECEIAECHGKCWVVFVYASTYAHKSEGNNGIIYSKKGTSDVICGL